MRAQAIIRLSAFAMSMGCWDREAARPQFEGSILKNWSPEGWLPSQLFTCLSVVWNLKQLMQSTLPDCNPVMLGGAAEVDTDIITP
jgi:hypothetical protein